MQQTCKHCSTGFEITNDDLKFYDSISPVYGEKKYALPPPTHCPDCRLQRRLATRNERKLYRRVCDLCGKITISSFPANSSFPVYCIDCWWSDRWNPMDYAQEFDFSRPFFAQFHELLQKVPKACVLQLNNENCDYNHLLAFSKNSYLCPGSYCIEDCIYARKSQYCRDCVDSNILNRCELVADSANSDSCFSSHHLINCRNCSSSAYLSDCTALKDCFMCSGLNQKQYCFRNELLTKDVYEKTVVREMRKSPEELLREFQEFSRTVPKRAQLQLNCENSTGDYLSSCNNALNCSDCFNIEDSNYLMECEGVKDSMDMSSHDKEIELCYEMCSGGEKNYQTMFSYCTIASARSAYLSSCFYLPDSFGCDGLHGRSSHCILNKHYSKEQYESLVPKIIDHMRKTGEWGEYFPIEISFYAYNESTAQDHFPLSREEAIRNGWQWHDEKDEMPKVTKIIPGKQLPDSIDDIPDDIVNWAIECEATKRPFKIIKQELDFYRKMHLPIPRLHPDERHRRRMLLRNPRKLWDRTCAKCNREIRTTYHPSRPEIIYCEQCYLKEMY
jgi:hypothetical protein